MASSQAVMRSGAWAAGAVAAKLLLDAVGNALRGKGFLRLLTRGVLGGLNFIAGWTSSFQLSTMLASEGASKPEGIFGTCKPGTTPGMIVVNTATK